VPRNTWPIIVGGCHRSGTSLFRRLLNAHSGIHCGPEIKFFRDFYGDYPSDPLSQMRFMATARTIVPEDELLEVMGEAFVTLHERAAARSGKRRWADKAPENVLYLAEWQRLLGDRWFFVHVVRHPLDTLASIKEARFPLTIPADLEGRIAFYRRYIVAGLEFGARHPSRYCLVQYEQLATSPESTLRRVMQQLDEAFEPGQLVFNDFPQERGLEDPKVSWTAGVHAGSISRWPAVLTDDEARTIRRQTQDLWTQVSADVELEPKGLPT
jgi:protein-tyrosine sulfotransferase